MQRAGRGGGPELAEREPVGRLPEPDHGAVYEHDVEIELRATPEAVFQALCRIGGRHGWYGAGILWRVRGMLDRLVGGPGLRRGRRDPERLDPGDHVDFWRVESLEPNRRLLLRGEMKLPGEALLGFEVGPVVGRPERTRLRLGARFKPHGLAGVLYWYALLPFHGIVFSSMLRGIRRATEPA